MDEIERSVPNFRGGNSDFLPLRRNELVELLADVLDTLLYRNIQPQLPSRPIVSTYRDNQTFWHEALSDDHRWGTRVRLLGFHLIEWMPSAPGQYFTLNAKSLRNKAEYYYISDKGEYHPTGKRFMVEGGIGSVRLGAKVIDSKNTFFLGASSTGISHQGIPIALYESEYHQVIQIIKEHGGCFTNLTGTLQKLPTELSLIQYDRQVPKLCLVLDDLEIIRPSLNSELLTTIAIAFQIDMYYSRTLWSWSFSSFYPGSANRKLVGEIDWLRNYANRYSNLHDPPILSDFDELYEHFPNPVTISLKKLLGNNLEIAPVVQNVVINEIGIQYVNQQILGDMIDARESQGFTSRPSGNVTQDFRSQHTVAIGSGDYAEGSIDKRSNDQSTNLKTSSPWASGSFYLVVFIVVIVALSVVGRLLPIYALPTVLIGGLLALSMIGAFQLRQDEKLSQKNFLELMALSFKYLPWIRSRNAKSNKA